MAAVAFLVLAAWPPWVARLSAVSEHLGRQVVPYHAPIWNRPAIYNHPRVTAKWNPDAFDCEPDAQNASSVESRLEVGKNLGLDKRFRHSLQSPV